MGFVSQSVVFPHFVAFNPSFLTTLPTTSPLRAEPQIQVLPPAAGKIENGKKQTANHKTPQKIAAEVTEEEEFKSLFTKDFQSSQKPTNNKDATTSNQQTPAKIAATPPLHPDSNPATYRPPNAHHPATSQFALLAAPPP
jgi:hypothetical protein